MPAGVDRHPDRVEAQLGAERPVANVGQPRSAIRRTWARLASSSVLPRPPDAGARVLTSTEDQHPPSHSDEIELAEPRAVVAGQDLVAEPLEVLGGERSPPAAEVWRAAGSTWRRDARCGGQNGSARGCAESAPILCLCRGGVRAAPP